MTANNENWLQRVRYTAAEPTSWSCHASTLRQAAHDLWIAGNQHDRNPGSLLGAQVLANWSSGDPTFVRPQTGGTTCDVCFMLMGFALENLAKGIIVCSDPSQVGRAKLRKWHGKGHDLVALFRQAGIVVDSDEHAALERTSRTTEWRGRYPVAMGFDNMGAQDMVIGHTVVSNIWPADEYARLCAIFDRAKQALVETMQRVPPLPVDYRFE